MPKIVVKDVKYGPNPYSIAQGGLYYYSFLIVFEDGSAPTEFTYEIFMMDSTNAVIKHWLDRIVANGGFEFPVYTAFELKTDSGLDFPIGNFKNKFKVTSPGYDAFDEFICSGGVVKPDDCDPCKDPDCDR